MSKINQIQNKLRELDGGAFQKLAEVYLYKEGYTRVNSVGSVAGADKVRAGTPDTFVTLPNGKYAFAEHTTQQSGVFRKFKVDLDKCFNHQNCSYNQIHKLQATLNLSKKLESNFKFFIFNVKYKKKCFV